MQFPLAEFIGGEFQGYGRLAGTWPFGKIEIFEDRLVFDLTFVTIRKADIVSIRRIGWIPFGVKFDHCISGNRGYVVFLTFRTERVFRALQNADWPVST